MTIFRLFLNFLLIHIYNQYYVHIYQYYFQINKKIEKYQDNGFDVEISNKLVIDSANLVCGTTMGIKQLTSIKNRNKILSKLINLHTNRFWLL